MVHGDRNIDCEATNSTQGLAEHKRTLQGGTTATSGGHKGGAHAPTTSTASTDIIQRTRTNQRLQRPHLYAAAADGCSMGVVTVQGQCG